ncbi:MAG: hypothetical protein R2939_11395 [Kofleriaceae bacterium]
MRANLRGPTLALLCAAAATLAACGSSADGPACSNGVDDDNDGLVDFPDDPGCTSADDPSEVNSPPPDCNDDFDNDGDGLIDYPDDPGCLSPLQDDESDDCPDGRDCPECANGIDDDGDGLVDFPDDIGCESASDTKEHIFNANACSNAPAVVEFTGATATGTIPGVASNLMGSCGGEGAEVVYEILVTEPQVLVASTDVGGTAIDTVLYLRSVCQDTATEIACNDDAGGVTSELIAAVDPGVYYLVVDGGPGVFGNFSLSVERFAGEGTPCAETSECGPGLVCKDPAGGSALVCTLPECDDGIDNDGDTLVDFPDDPGCASRFDDDETDDCPSGPNCPACSNGLDDDSDTFIDYPDDDSCQSAGLPVEGCGIEMEPVLVATSGTTTGSTVGTSDDFTPSCASDGDAGDIVVFADLPATSTLTVSTTGSNFDTILSILPGTCSGTSLGCDDEGGGSGTSRIVKTNFPAGLYAFVVDGYFGDEGAVKFNLTGTIAPGGRCDGTLAASGALSCGSGYECGPAGTCVGMFECNDGVDNDGDLLVDYPNEPGCESPLDDDEADTCPSGPDCPACSNDLDDDGDGQIDFGADTSCTFAAGTSEACPSSEPVVALTQPVTAGDTTGHVHDLRPACSSTTNSAPDDIYQLDLPATTTITIAQTSTTGWDSVIELRDSSCGGTAIQCADSPTITRTNLAAGRYFLIVDGYSTAFGAYNVTVSGELASGASCEGALAASGALTCADGFACKGTPGSRTCAPAACNDAIDADGDGLPGFPSDPGCSSPSDDDEADDCPSGPNCPACSNDVDDDGDLFIDYGVDLTCGAASTSIEGCGPEVSPIFDVVAAVTTSTTSGLSDQFTAGSPCTFSTAAGPDRVHALVLPVPVASLTVDTNGSSLDTILSMYDGVCASRLACDDDGGDGLQSTFTLTNVAAGTYGIVVDSYGATGGAYSLKVRGTVAAGTACTSPLFGAGVLACPTGMSCTAGTCQ